MSDNASSNLADLLDAARRSKLEVDGALSAFRALTFDDQLRFLVTIEPEIVAQVGGGVTTIPLSAAAHAAQAIRPALPAAAAAPIPTPIVAECNERDPKRPNGSPPSSSAAIYQPKRFGPGNTGKMGRGYGPDVVAKVCELFDQGLSQGEICKHVNISYPTVNKMLRGAGRSTHLRTRARSSAGKPRAGRSDDSEGSPRSSTVAPGAPALPPRKLLAGAEELALAARLEDLEVAAWQLVQGTPALSGHPDVACLVRELGAAARPDDVALGVITVIDTAGLRAADVDRVSMDRIVAIASDLGPELGAVRDQLGQLATEARRIRHHFVQANLGLVGMMAKKLLWTGLAYDDLMQEGTLGLMRAVGGFDHRRQMRFSTYATWWIKHRINRYRENSAEVRIPVHLHTTKSKIYMATLALRKELRREPTPAEVARRAGLTAAQLEAVSGPGWWITGASISLDHPVTPDGATFGEAFADPETEVTALDHLVENETLERIRHTLDRLPTFEATILRRRFGIDCEPQILVDIGADFELSKERIRQLEHRALDRLRSMLGELSPS